MIFGETIDPVIRGDPAIDRFGSGDSAPMGGEMKRIQARLLNRRNTTRSSFCWIRVEGNDAEETGGFDVCAA